MNKEPEAAVEVRRTLKIQNRLGLHARAAVKFVQLAGKYRSDVRVEREDQHANGKSIMGLLTLVAACGVTIDLVVCGPDADQAAEALAALVQSGFDEGVEQDA